MAKSFDFNSFDQASLPVTFGDNDCTTINVTTPPEHLIEKLLANAAVIDKLKNGNDSEIVAKSFQFGAEILSHNKEGLRINATDLKEKYRVGVLGLVAFFSAYTDFIAEITNAKN